MIGPLSSVYLGKELGSDQPNNFCEGGESNCIPKKEGIKKAVLVPSHFFSFK